MSLFVELKRRNVFRVAVAYVLLGWAVLQSADFLLDLAGAPEWIIRVFAIAGLVGFPFALFFAWAYELTPEGVRREKDVDRSRSITPQTGRKLDRMIMALLVLVIVMMVVERVYFADGTPPEDAPETAESISTVAVLPFVNMSADANQEYFSDGVTEEIINTLVRVPGVKVAARTSVFAFKDHEQDVREIGRVLGVTHVVEGSVRSDGQQLRITAQLIQVSDGFHLWSETFNRERAGLFAIQEEIARAIAQELRNTLGRDPAKTEGEFLTPSLAGIEVDAYDDYLRGRSLLRARTSGDVLEARGVLLSVAERFPDYAPAWAALAIASDVMDDHGPAEQYGLRALALDPGNVDALTALGGVCRDTYRWLEAEEYFERALALDPGSAELLEDYGEFLSSVARHAELLEVTRRGYAVDRYLDPMVGVYAEALIVNGQFAEARDVLEQALLRGGATWLRVNLAQALVGLQDTPGLLELIDTLEGPPEYIAAVRATVYDPDDRAAADQLAELLQSTPYDPYAWTSLTGIAGMLLIHNRDTEVAFKLYRQYLADRAFVYVGFWFLPASAPLRTRSDFEELLELSGLPDYWDRAGWPELCRRQSGAIICR